MSNHILHNSTFAHEAAEAAIELTRSMLRSRREPLSDAVVGPMPIVYAVYLDQAPYQDRWPFYVGLTWNGRRRVSDHRATFSDAEGIRPEGVTFAWMAASSHALASWAELTLLEHVAPVGNIVLPGAGCKPRGIIRATGTTTKFRTMHPKRGVAVDVNEQRALRRKVVEHLEKTTPPSWALEVLD